MKPCNVCGGPISGKSGEEPLKHDDPQECIKHLQERSAVAEKSARAYKWLVEGFRVLDHNVMVSNIIKERDKVLRCHLSCTCCSPPHGLTLFMPLTEVVEYLGKTEAKHLALKST